MSSHSKASKPKLIGLVVFENWTFSKMGTSSVDIDQVFSSRSIVAIKLKSSPGAKSNSVSNWVVPFSRQIPNCEFALLGLSLSKRTEARRFPFSL